MYRYELNSFLIRASDLNRKKSIKGIHKILEFFQKFRLKPRPFDMYSSYDWTPKFWHSKLKLQELLIFIYWLKVSKSRKQILKFSFEPKMTRKIWRISALRDFTVHRAEILQIFWVIFGSNENFKICFRDLLTFSQPLH